jgi:hypothetical protein
MITDAGSSTADARISPHQRLTLKPPSVMDLHTFGCHAVVLKPPFAQHKPSLSTRGWEGIFLGRAPHSKGTYRFLVGRKVVESSSAMVNEETMPWAPKGEQARPLAPAAPRHTAKPASNGAGHADADADGNGGGDAGRASASASSSNAASNAPSSNAGGCDGSGADTALNLFAGDYSRADGLTAKLIASNKWDKVVQIDNDGERGGGWSHDLLNDSNFASLMRRAKEGEFDSMVIAFPCSTSSVSRLFDASTEDNPDPGPPQIRTAEHPDGLPLDQIDPKHRRELEFSNLLLERTVTLAIAARGSKAKTKLLFENPADRTDPECPSHSKFFSNAASIFKTSAFKRLLTAAGGLEKATFAYCRLLAQRVQEKMKN